MSEPLERPRLLTTAEAQRFTFGGGEVNVMLETPTLACGIFVLEQGAHGSTDVHIRAEEISLVLEGTVEYLTRGASFIVSAGSGIAIPPGWAHDVRNAGTGRAVLFWAYAPNDRD